MTNNLPPEKNQEQQNRIKMLKQLYRAYNQRDIETATEFMAPNIEWHRNNRKAFVKNQDGVSTYWHEQWKTNAPHIDPLYFQIESNGQISVEVHLVVRDGSGDLIADEQQGHRFTLTSGLISKMEMYDT